MKLPAQVQAALRAASGRRTDAQPDAPAIPQVREDGWFSDSTGIGTWRDKRTTGAFERDAVSDTEALELWGTNDLAARAIEVYPDEMLRAGYDICVKAEDDSGADLAREQGEAIETALADLDSDGAMHSALCKERAFGGAAIFPVTHDMQASLAAPLNERSIAGIRHLLVLEPRDLQALTYYSDPTAPKFGQPATYRMQPQVVYGVQPQPVTIHESRLIIFPGINVSLRQRSQWPGWGHSVFSRIVETLRDFGMGFGSLSHLLNDFAQAVYALRGVHDSAAAGRGELIRRRMELMDVARSLVRGIVLDAGNATTPPETFRRESTSVAGIPEVIDRLMSRLASALEMPVTMLFGTSPGGLNATGESDIKLFEKRVAQKQDKHLRPRLTRLIKLLLLSREGPTGGIVPDKWQIDFCPLSQPSQKEIVDTRYTQAQTDAIYIANGVNSPEDVARSRFGGDDYSHETKVDFAALDRIQAAEDARAAAAPAVPPAEVETPAGEETED